MTYEPPEAGVPEHAAASDDIADLLLRQRNGDARAGEQVLARVYGELRRLARRHLARSRWIETLNTTSLVNESYLRLVAPAAQGPQTRAHYLHLASRIMRQVVCDYARKRLRERVHVDRGHDASDAAALDEADRHHADRLVRLDEALADLARIHPVQAQIVECRFFAGLTEDETASALGRSVRTVQRDWNAARAWLARTMRPE